MNLTVVICHFQENLSWVDSIKHKVVVYNKNPNETDLYVTHSLGVRYPHVQIYETGSAGTEAQILPLDIISIDENTTRVRFSGPTTGKAVIGKAGSVLSGTINGDRVLGTVLSASFAINAGTAESIQGFDSASLSALSASLAGGSQYVLNSQTSSMSVFSASFASIAEFALNATTIDTGSFVQTSQTSSMSVLFAIENMAKNVIRKQNLSQSLK
jgi:hypothetical protein